MFIIVDNEDYERAAYFGKTLDEAIEDYKTINDQIPDLEKGKFRIFEATEKVLKITKTLINKSTEDKKRISNKPIQKKTTK